MYEQLLLRLLFEEGGLEKLVSDTDPLPVTHAGLLERLNEVLDVNLNLGDIAVSGANPIPITGNVVSSGAELQIDKALDVQNFDLQSNEFSQITTVGGDFRFNGLELTFTTDEPREIYLTTENGVVLFSAYSKELQTARDLSIPGSDRAFDAGDQLSLIITQTTGPCFVDVELKIERGALPLSGNPALSASDDITTSYRDTDNSGPTDALVANEQLYTPWVDTQGYATLIASVFSNKDGAKDGYQVQFSADQSNVRASTPPITVVGNKEETITTSASLRYARLAYKAGSEDQDDFILTLTRAVLPHNARLLSDIVDSLGNNGFDFKQQQPAPLQNGAITQLVVDDTTDEVVSVAHGLTENQRIVLTEDVPGLDTLPDGLSTSPAYFVVNPTADRFQLSETESGTPVVINDVGVGLFYYQQRGWFRGDFVDVSDIGHFLAVMISTSDPHIMNIEWSEDGVNRVDDIIASSAMRVEEFTEIPNVGTLYVSVHPGTTMIRKYYRLDHVNGPAGEIPGLYLVNSFVGKHPYTGSYASLTAPLSPLSTALLTRSVGVGNTFSGDFKNVQIGEHAIDENNRSSDPLSNTAIGDFTVDDTTDELLIVGHGLVDGDAIQVLSDDTLPAGLEYINATTGDDIIYWVTEATDDTFKVTTNTATNAVVDITDTGTGTHSIVQRGQFLGEFSDISQVGHLLSFYFSSVKPAHLRLEWSDDGETQNQSLLSNTDIPIEEIDSDFGILYVGLTVNNTMIAPYYRFRVVNGDGTEIPGLKEQIPFIGRDAFQGTFGGLTADLSPLSTALLTRSVEAGTTLAGDFKNKLLEEHYVDPGNTFESVPLTNSALVEFTVDTGTDVLQAIAHGLEDGDPIVVTTTLDLPDPLNNDDVYYVINKTDDDFQITSSPYSQTIIPITDDGLGTHSFQKRGTVTGEFLDVSQVGHILFLVFDVQEPAQAILEWSDDGINVNQSLVRASTNLSFRRIDTDTLTYYIALSPVTTFVAKYYRFRMVNGPNSQIPGLFSIIPFIGKGPYGGTYVGLDEDLSLLTTAQVVRSLQVGVDPDNKFGNLRKQGRDSANSANGRIFTDAVTTAGSDVLTSVTGDFREGEQGTVVVGTGIPVATTIDKVLSSTAIKLSQDATITDTGVSVTMGKVLPGDTGGTDHIFVGKWQKWQNSFIDMVMDGISSSDAIVMMEFTEVEFPKEYVDDDVHDSITIPYQAYTLLRRHTTLQSKHVRVKWVNSIEDQTFFNLDVAFTTEAVSPPMQPIIIPPGPKKLGRI